MSVLHLYFCKLKATCYAFHYFLFVLNMANISDAFLVLARDVLTVRGHYDHNVNTEAPPTAVQTYL